MERRRTLPPALALTFVAVILTLLVLGAAGYVDLFWPVLAGSTLVGAVGVLRIAGVLDRPPEQPGLRYDLLHLLVGAGGLVGLALRLAA